MKSHLYVCVQNYRLMNVEFSPKTDFILVISIISECLKGSY